MPQIFCTRRLASLDNDLPGVRSYYNNLNYYLLRLLIEKVSGDPYAQYIKKQVLEPAGVTGMDTKSSEPAGWDARLLREPLVGTLQQLI